MLYDPGHREDFEIVTLLGQSSLPWVYAFDDGHDSESAELGSTLGLQDENSIEELHHLRDHIVNFNVLVEGRSVL